jgi:hypothetical protein
MDILIVDAFCKEYGTQSRKEESEAEAIVALIDSDALRALCIKFDNDVGDYPEHEYEGAAFFAFFEELKKEVKKRI